jgi:transposase
MIGPIQQNEAKLFHYGINLEKRVRSSNPLRAIKQRIDFSFVRPRVAGFYGKDGHESEDPIVIMKLMLLLFMDDVGSERELMRIVGERLDYLWFLDFDLDDEIPNHSVLSKARKRWGGEVFEELFVATVRQCVESGLVDGQKIHMDGSFVEAHASRESVRKGPPELIEALRQVYRGQVAKLDETHDSDSDDGAKRRRSPVATVSATDPDAAVARKTDGDPPRLRYKNHRAVDDQCGVITAVETTPGNVLENHKLMALVHRHESNTGERVGTIVADAQYGTNENFAACQQRQIRSHMKDLRSTFRHDAAKQGIFKESDFRYEEETQTYICPAGERLKPRKTLDRGFYVFKSDSKVCQQCQLRGQCLKSKKHVRTLKRHVAHEEIQRARAESHSGWARRDRRRRKHLMEGSFADATNHHGFKRARWRRLHNQKIQDLLIASCQNIRILMQNRLRKQAAAMVVQLPKPRFVQVLTLCPSAYPATATHQNQTVLRSTMDLLFSLANVQRFPQIGTIVEQQSLVRRGLSILEAFFVFQASSKADRRVAPRRAL